MGEKKEARFGLGPKRAGWMLSIRQSLEFAVHILRV